MKRKQPEPESSKAPGFTRRAMLQWTGLAITGVALPATARNANSFAQTANSQKSAGSAMNELSAYMSEAARRSLPAEVSEKTKHHILDTVAAMISGSRLLPGERAFLHAIKHEAVLVGFFRSHRIRVVDEAHELEPLVARHGEQEPQEVDFHP